MKKPNASEWEASIDPEKYQVFLFTCPAYIPFQFAVHPWLVVNKKGAVTRWEVGHTKENAPNYFGYIRSDGLPLFKGLPMLGYRLPYSWGGKHIKLRGAIEGDDARKIGDFIENATTAYPYRDVYRLTGPNSNTYVQWILDAFPKWNVTLPLNAIGKNYAKAKIAVGVIHGRFQPPHNGHIRYILSALEKADHLLIGICTPKICTEEEAAKTGYPCTAKLNPFTHDERAEMISLALDEAGVSRDRYSCIPFPSDYKNLDAVLPKDAVFLMSVTGESDRKKIAYIESLGFKAQTILSMPSTDSRERSGTVRNSAQSGQSDWENMVPESIARYMKEHGLLGRL